jgi:integrase
MAKSSKRKGRRARGTGSIFFSKARKVWIGRKTVGKNARGKPIKVEVWGETQAEVVKKLAAAGPPGPETTVGAYAERWLTLIDVRPATFTAYSVSVKNHIVPALGSIRIRDLTTGRIEQFGSKLVKDGDMAATTARGTMDRLRAMLGAAVRDGLISINPAIGTRKPRGAGKRLEPYTPAELARIIAHADHYTAGPVLALLAGVGCRVGEALALDVPDFDPAAGTISITKTYDYIHGLGEPKSPHSIRTIKVPPPLLPILRAAVGVRTSGPLFESQAGTRQILVSLRKAWHRTCRDLNLEVRKPHQLRHSVATALISAQVPLGDVAKYLGDRVETIVKTYLHPTGVDPSVALGVLLGGGKVGG